MELRRSSGGDLTQTAVLALLGRAGPLSRADIARELDLSPATVSSVTKRLVAHGMVEELDRQAPSRGGRPGQLVGLVGSAARALGVKVAVDHITVVEARLDGTVLESHSLPFDAVAADPAGRLASALRPFVRERDEIPLLGLGVAVPGVVDRPDHGSVRVPVLGWTDVPLGRHLRGALGLPVLVENDVNAVAIAEQLFGRGRHYRDFVVVTIGVGIGLAVVTDGRIYRGAHGGAGEFGHLPVQADGRLCRCGNRGCLESLIGEEGLLAAARSGRLLRRDQGMDRLQELADRGNARALATYAEAGGILARALAAVMAVLDPEAVILLGEGVSGWRHWEDTFRTTLDTVAPPHVRGTPVFVESWDDSTWAQGAAALVLGTPLDTDGFAGQQASSVLARLAQRG